MYPPCAAGDVHEEGIAEAVAEMLGVPVFIGVGLRDPRNEVVNFFLRTMQNNAMTINLDVNIPEDVVRANSGERARNVERLSNACSDMIFIECDAPPLFLSLIHISEPTRPY